MFVHNLTILIRLNLYKRLFDKIINLTRNAKQNLKTNKKQATFQRSQNNKNANNQLIFNNITKIYIILQEEILQNNDVAKLSQFDKDINYKKLLIKEKVKKHRL